MITNSFAPSVNDLASLNINIPTVTHSAISIYAGQTAFETIQQQGLAPALVNVMAGASGGPKCLILNGLDRYLFGEFFQDINHDLHTIGSSIGAWRMACFAQQDPVKAIDRLNEYCAIERYSARPTTDEISRKARRMLDYTLSREGVSQVVNNKHIHSHVIISRCKGLVGLENKPLQLLGLIMAASTNYMNREHLGRFFDRVICHARDHSFFRLNDFNTDYLRITEDNLKTILMASGAIPLLLKGITTIEDNGGACYRDGGLIDYHFDIPFSQQGIVLYPHFSPLIKPGWFDKNLKARKVQSKHYHNVVVITPSAEFIASLKYQKIPDRTDFTKMDANTRIKYWKTVLREGQRLGDDLQALVEKRQGIDDIRPIEELL